MNLVDANGKPIISEQKKQADKTDRILDFREWVAKAIDSTNKAAWEYQQETINLLMQSFDKIVAEQILAKHGGLVETLKEKEKTIQELKQFCEENIKLISDLEIKVMQLEGKLHE